MRFLIRWLITSLSLGLAVWIVPGITLDDDRAIFAVIVTALVLGALNAVVRPILTFLACGFVVITLGIGLLFINGLMLYWASWISVHWFGIGFAVDGYWAAFWGSVVISVASFMMNAFVPDTREERMAVWGSRD